MPSGYGQRHVRLPWLLPYLGQVKEGVERGKASDGQKPVRTGTGGGKRLVPTPIGIDPCATSMPICQRCCEATMPTTAYRATLDAYDGSPARSWCSGRNGWRDGIVEKARSNGPASTRSSNAIRFPRRGSCTAYTPTRAKLSREEPDAGNLHVRVCPAKAGMFSRRKACQGKSQKPRSFG
jgi:hypothetical protein